VRPQGWFQRAGLYPSCFWSAFGLDWGKTGGTMDFRLGISMRKVAVCGTYSGAFEMPVDWKKFAWPRLNAEYWRVS
jgi:hypothetical protein